MSNPSTPQQPTRPGDWILTRSGHRFYPLDPRPQDIALDDIAYSLANQCRWTGHCRRHYSIAQHACYVALTVEAILPSLARAALHHDSAEAYVGDMARPWKRLLQVKMGDESVASVNEIENHILGVIFWQLEMAPPIPTEWRTIHHVDNRVMQTERLHLLPADDAPGWALLGDVIPGLEIATWTPEAAARNFLDLDARLVRDYGVRS